jgi:hypothetical protein
MAAKIRQIPDCGNLRFFKEISFSPSPNPIENVVSMLSLMCVTIWSSDPALALTGTSPFVSLIVTTNDVSLTSHDKIKKNRE